MKIRTYLLLMPALFVAACLSAGQLFAAQDDKGRWVTRTKLETRGMTFGDRIESRVFIDNMRVLSAYLALLK